MFSTFIRLYSLAQVASSQFRSRASAAIKVSSPLAMGQCGRAVVIAARSATARLLQLDITMWKSGDVLEKPAKLDMARFSHRVSSQGRLALFYKFPCIDGFLRLAQSVAQLVARTIDPQGGTTSL